MIANALARYDVDRFGMPSLEEDDYLDQADLILNVIAEYELMRRNA